MIYTITFNPAIDLVVKVPNCELGALNRSVEENYVAGGKGINMSVILKRLGFDNTATGFLAGFSGNFIKEALQSEGIGTDFIQIDGVTRINLKLKSNEETEINAKGPIVSEEDFGRLVSYFEERLQEEDVVFLAGNAGNGMNHSAYTAIAKLCDEKGVKLVLDTTKDLLTKCLPYHPFIIKPNHLELGEIFGVTIETEEQIVNYARQLQQMGARNVLISRGGDGALLITEAGEVYTSNVPKGTLVNSVGAGDSMLSGFMAKFMETGDYAASLKQGAATGSATAFSVGIAEKSFIEKLLPQVVVKKL